jgi:hypothetical protein
MPFSPSWSQSNSPPPTPARPTLAARLRPHELIAMLTHHYTRVRARSLPRVSTTLVVRNPAGRQAVVIGWE